MNIQFTHQEIENIAKQIWQQYAHKKVWAFFAPMGVGKTTFIHTLCQKILRVNDNISSPTFAIINEYESPIIGNILHMDWYRLKNVEEAIYTGIADAIDSGKLCLIEWPEKAEALLPIHALKITLEMIDENTRSISI